MKGRGGGGGGKGVQTPNLKPGVCHKGNQTNGYKLCEHRLYMSNLHCNPDANHGKFLHSYME